MINIIIFLSILLVFSAIILFVSVSSKRSYNEIIPCEIARQCKNGKYKNNNYVAVLNNKNKWIKSNEDINFEDETLDINDYFYKSRRTIPRKIHVKDNKLFIDNDVVYEFEDEEKVIDISTDKGCLAIMTKCKLQNRLYFTDNYLKNKLRRVDGNFPRMRMKVQDEQLFARFDSVCV